MFDKASHDATTFFLLDSKSYSLQSRASNPNLDSDLLHAQTHGCNLNLSFHKRNITQAFSPG